MTMPAAIEWSKEPTYDGVTEWFGRLDGRPVGTISRERPLRMASGRRGWARDASQPYEFTVDLIPGKVYSSLTEAKHAAAAKAVALARP